MLIICSSAIEWWVTIDKNSCYTEFKPDRTQVIIATVLFVFLPTRR